MALYCIGDIQGCHDAFERLLRRVDFSASRDTLYILGDLVNRGPESDKVLRTCMAAGDSMRALLGNHDLHLLAAAQGVRRSSRRDTLARVLDAPDRDQLLDWLRHQPLARSHRTAHGEELLMVHAGVLPQWSIDDTLGVAAELESVLRGPSLADFMQTMYGNEPVQWSNALSGSARLRVIVNALTRLRFCSAEGEMEFDSKDGAAAAPEGFMPWFDVPGRRTSAATVAFGHWSTLGWLSRPDLLSTDTGCVWGGCLSAVRIGATLQDRERIQVRCPQSQKPG